MAYNRIGRYVFVNHNWCRNCNIITKDKSIIRCPSCNCKVRMKPRSYGQKVIQKEINLSKRIINTVLDLMEDKRGLTIRRVIELTHQKTGVNILNETI